MSGSYLGATRRRGRVTEVATGWELRTATALQPSTAGKCSPQVCTDRLLRLMTVHLTPLPPQATFLDLPVSRPTKWSNSPPSFDPRARFARDFVLPGRQKAPPCRPSPISGPRRSAECKLTLQLGRSYMKEIHVRPTQTPKVPGSLIPGSLDSSSSPGWICLLKCFEGQCLFWGLLPYIPTLATKRSTEMAPREPRYGGANTKPCNYSDLLRVSLPHSPTPFRAV